MEKNAFDPIKLYAALAIMVMHYTGYQLIASDNMHGLVYALRCISRLFIPLMLFFSISGFLCAGSCDRYASFFEYLKRRIFRLYPHLWICTLVMLITVPFLGCPEFLTLQNLYKYLPAQFIGVAYTPKCFKPYGTGSINGTLWTVMVQFQLFILTKLIFKWLKKLSVLSWTVLLVMLAFINILCRYLADRYTGLFAKAIERSFLPYAIWFFIGVFCNLFFERIIPVLKKIWPLLAAASIISTMGMIPDYGYYEGILVSVSCPFLAIAAGYILPPARFKEDISLELFLYHWIVLNFFVQFGIMEKVSPILSFLMFMVIGIAFSCVMHILSKKMIKLWRDR